MSALTLISQAAAGLRPVAVVGQMVDPGTNTDFPGFNLATRLLGNLKWLALAGCLASLFMGGLTWGLANAGGNSTGATWGRRFALGGAVGAVIVGLAVQIVNTFSTVT